MDHHDHVRLIRGGVLPTPNDPTAPRVDQIWADLGSGSGAFTLALADVLDGFGTIHSIDRDRRALREQERAMRAQFPTSAVSYHVADFTQPLDLPLLDGIVMANAVHFVRDTRPLIEHLRSLLRPGGRFVLVEYNTDRGNHWVPYPLAFPTWEVLARESGFVTTRLLTTVPSRFLGEIYSAVSS